METLELDSFWAFFCQRLHKIDKLIPHLAQQYPNKIHAFRLEIKRMNALLEMLSFRHNYEIEVGEVKNLLRPIYKSSGYQRKMNIHLKLLNQVKLPHIKDFTHYLFEKKAYYQNELLTKANEFIYGPNYPLTEIVCDILHPHAEEGLTICYVQKLQDELEFIVHANYQEEDVHNLHQLRKSIKTVLLLYKVDPCFHDILHFKQNFIKRLDTMAKKIGNWHDWVELNQTLTKYLQENPELRVNVNMIRLRYKVKNEMDRLWQPISEKSSSLELV